MALQALASMSYPLAGLSGPAFRSDDRGQRVVRAPIVGMQAAPGANQGPSQVHEPRSAHPPPLGKAHRFRSRKHRYTSHSSTGYAQGPLDLNEEGRFDPLVVVTEDKQKEEPEFKKDAPIWHWNDFWLPRLFWLLKALGSAID